MGIGDGASGAGAVHHAGNAHADAAAFLNDALGLEAGNTGGDNVLSNDAALTGVDAKRLRVITLSTRSVKMARLPIWRPSS